MALVDALHARNEPLLTTPRSVRSVTKYTYGRRRRIRSNAAIGSNQMDEDGIYGGRIGRSTGGSTMPTPSNSADAASAAAVSKSLNLHQCRSYTSVLLILSFVQNLLQSKRTTTTREVYYHYVTHFRSQRECDAAILECAALLQVPRVALGLAASPKGWFCGCVEILRCDNDEDGDEDGGVDDGSVDGETTTDVAADYGRNRAQSRVDGTALSSVQGLPITREWIDRSTTMQSTAKRSTSSSGIGSGNASQPFQISSRNAKCILVIEKEGVYTRLSEDRFYDKFPCILVTGKGYPDLATRALVYTLHTELGLPVYGLCDCNPYGIGVLQTYRRGSPRMGLDGTERYGVPIQWVGLRPSQVYVMRSGSSALPSNVFQALTDLDRKKIARLGEEGSAFASGGDITAKCRMYRRQELALMDEMGIKVELESLHWMGMDYMCKWLEKIMRGHEMLQKELQKEEEGEEEERASSIDSCSVKDISDDDASCSTCSASSSSLNGKEEMIRSLSIVCIL